MLPWHFSLSKTCLQDSTMTGQQLPVLLFRPNLWLSKPPHHNWHREHGSMLWRYSPNPSLSIHFAPSPGLKGTKLALVGTSLEPRLSILDFTSDFSSKQRDKIWNWKPGFGARLEHQVTVSKLIIYPYLALFCINTSRSKQKVLTAKRFDYPAAVLFSSNREHERYSW